MAVKSTLNSNGKLELLIDNGDLTKMQEAIQRWNLKDEQALLRFCISALIESDENKIGIMENGSLVPIIPADHSIKDKD